MKTYNYNPFIKKIYWSVIVLLIIAEMITLRVHIYEIMQGTLIEGLVKIIVLSTFILTTLFRLILFVRPRIFSEYELREDRILIRFKSRVKEVRFSEIKSISILPFSPRFLGGFKIDLLSGGRFLFLSLLENNHEILQAIVTQKPELIDQTRLTKYILVSTYVKRAWRRMRKAFTKPLFYISYLVLPLIFAFFLDLPSLDYFVLVIVGFLFLGFLFNILEEFLIVKKIQSKQSLEGIEGVEKQACWLTLVGYYLVFLVIVYLSLF